MASYLRRLDSLPVVDDARSAAEEVEEPHSDSALESVLAAVVSGDGCGDDAYNGDDIGDIDGDDGYNGDDIDDIDIDIDNNNHNHNHNAISNAADTDNNNTNHDLVNHTTTHLTRTSHANADQLTARTVQHMLQSPTRPLTNQSFLVVMQGMLALQQRANHNIHANILHTTQTISSHVSAVGLLSPSTRRKRSAREKR